MELVDPSQPDHAKALAEIKAFLRRPADCRPTGRVKTDLIRLKLSKGEVLDHALHHIEAGEAMHCQMQTMYFEKPTLGYVIRPLIVGNVALYFKIAIAPLKKGEKPYLQILSIHEPKL